MYCLTGQTAKIGSVTDLSSILTPFCFSSWNDTTLEDLGDRSVILLLVLLVKVLDEASLLHSCSPLLCLTSVVMVTNVPLLGCWHGALLIVWDILTSVLQIIQIPYGGFFLRNTATYLFCGHNLCRWAVCRKLIAYREHGQEDSHWNSDGHEGMCSSIRLTLC